MPRLKHQEALDFINNAVKTAEPLADAHEIKIIEHQIEAMNEEVKVLVRLDDDPAVISDALIMGLKSLNMSTENGATFVGTKMDWGKDGQDFVLLFFSVDMMHNCGGY